MGFVSNKGKINIHIRLCRGLGDIYDLELQNIALPID